MSLELSYRIAQQVRRLREAKGLTQEAFAFNAGLALRHVQKVEAGQVNLTLITLTKLAQALDVDPSALLTLTQKEPPQSELLR